MQICACVAILHAETNLEFLELGFRGSRDVLLFVVVSFLFLVLFAIEMRRVFVCVCIGVCTYSFTDPPL